MAGEWVETTLGEVTDFLSGGTPSKSRADYWIGTVPWVSAKDMKRFRLEDTEDHISEEAAENGTRLAPAGSVLLLTRGMTLLNDLPICVIAQPMTFNQDVKALRPKPGVRDDYLPYLLLGNKERLLSLVDLAGHGTGRLNSDELKALDVALPPEPEQRAIAHILGTLDDKIELNRRMSETLEAMARALFKSWFVDFLPVRAKMAAKERDPSLLLPQAEPNTWYVYAIECNDGSLYIGQTEDLRQRWLQHVGGKGASWTKQHPPVQVPYWEKQPSREAAVERENWLKTGYGRKWLKHEIAARTQTGDPVRAKAEGRDPGLPQPLADLFPDSFEDSELGEIPRGWEVKRLSDLCSTQYGYTASAVDQPIGPKLLRVTDINKRNWIEWADVPYCAIDADARPFYALQVGDLVVARMADPGKSAIIEEKIDAVFASYLVRLKTASLAHSYYVYGFLKSDIYAEYADGAKSGSVQANMNAKVIAGASLVVPPTTVMERFLGAVLPFRQRIVANVHESRTLAALRDALLPKLISGELRVKDAEKFIGGNT